MKQTNKRYVTGGTVTGTGTITGPVSLTGGAVADQPKTKPVKKTPLRNKLSD